MKVLVTGATGFIGRYVYNKLLKTNIDFYLTSRNARNDIKNCYILDILNYQDTQALIKKIKPDILIHLAWDVSHGEFWTSSKNICYAEATINLFKLFINEGGKKIIAAGTCAEYPTSSQVVFEHLVYQGELSEYGKAKQVVYNFLKSCELANTIEFTWFRIFGIFGDRENKQRFFPSAINAIKNGEVLKIKEPGSFCDYVYVDDLAYFIVACIDKVGLGAVNIGTGEAMSMMAMYKLIENYMKTGIFKIVKTTQKASENSRIPNCKKLQRNGFHFTLQHGLHVERIQEFQIAKSYKEIVENNDELSQL